MYVAPYLFFNGDCRQAMAFYANVLGGEVVALNEVGQAPAEARMPDMPDDAVMHAMVVAGDVTLMASDACPPQGYVPPQGMTVSLQVDTALEAETLFAALADGAQVHIPLEQTFWSARFGMLTDRFGIPWMINVAQACDTGDDEA